ncbi:glycogen debranching N-terminal domain-containing protein [Sphaerisporangium dianthi]|uniref:Glycogen debranching N-terminal domain-containing protein n=1 Tax=Sphaerisporangium dianthi TaxID=1436120 RepID=A0ABV9CCU5_9ACTN
MTGRRLLVGDGTFAALTASGDVEGGRGTATDGLFVRDARHLSRWRLTADGASPALLTSTDDGCVLAPPGTRDAPPAHTLFRRQAVAESAFTEHLQVVCNRGEPTVVTVEVHVDADFADQFELRADHRAYAKPGVRRAVRDTPDGVAFDYHRDEPGHRSAETGPGESGGGGHHGGSWWSRTVVAACPAPGHIRPAEDGGTGRVLTWRFELPAHGTADLALTVVAVPHGAPEPPGPENPAAVRDRQRARARAFVHADPAPGSLTTWEGLARACEQGLADLDRLRIPAAGPGGERLRAPAAGIPWFLALFGRDALLTSLFALPYRPELAGHTLLALAATQGTREDPSRLEQPGRIVHEVRHGELAHFRQVPYGRYYGSADATPLFLVLLEAHAAATGDSLARRLEPHARAAVAWMFRDGGLGEHGYLRYTSDAARGGLANQNWKDSPGAICFADGRQAEGALAVCEVQGYAYDALVRTARLARTVWGDPREAGRLEEAAADLRTRFRRDFWMPGQDFPALALDGDGRQADALASDAGHLLWSGILDPDQERAVGRRLLAPDFFSGFGVRTLAAGQAPYHPLSYHRGSIWPHDNAVIALGLARAGLAEQAAAVARGLVEAAAPHGWRLPEVLAGYGREEHPAPVPYPHSSSPQAWAAAAPLALLTALRGSPASEEGTAGA